MSHTTSDSKQVHVRESDSQNRSVNGLVSQVRCRGRKVGNVRLESQIYSYFSQKIQVHKVQGVNAVHNIPGLTQGATSSSLWPCNVHFWLEYFILGKTFTGKKTTTYMYMYNILHTLPTYTGLQNHIHVYTRTYIVPQQKNNQVHQSS